MPIQANQIKFKVRLLQTLWILVAAFQVLVLAELIDYRYVAGGRLSSFEEARQMLPIAILLLLAFAFSLEKFYQSVVEHGWAKKWLRGLILVIGLYSILNTVGNLMAYSLLEKILFTPVTLISSVLCLQMALKSGKA